MAEEVLIQLRDLIVAAVETERQADPSKYGITTFATEATWIPYEEMESMSANFPNGKLYTIGSDFDDSIISRNTTVEVEIGIMMGFQRINVAPSNKELIDQLVTLKQAIRATVRESDYPNFGYLRTETVKDETGLPFSFHTIRSGSLFEALWTSYFKAVITPDDD